MADQNLRLYIEYIRHDITKAMDLLKIGMTRLGLENIEGAEDASVIIRCTHGVLETLERNIDKHLKAVAAAHE